MHILITGGGGFLGQRLAQQLLKNPDLKRLTLVDVAPLDGAFDDDRVLSVKADLSDPQVAQTLIKPEMTAIYHWRRW